jgi:hypothetical protein
VYGLNLTVPEDAKCIIKPWDERDDTSKCAESGVDDQVRLHLSVNLSGLHSHTRSSSTYPLPRTFGYGLSFSGWVSIFYTLSFASRHSFLPGRGEVTPRHLRIYANHPQIIDFADADTTKPQLDISLLEGESGVTEYPLRVAAFASISSLSLFFVSRVSSCLLISCTISMEQRDSIGGELSRIYYVGFKGDVRSPGREPESKLAVPAANAADAPIFDRLSEKTGGQQTTAR